MKFASEDLIIPDADVQLSVPQYLCVPQFIKYVRAGVVIIMLEQHIIGLHSR